MVYIFQILKVATNGKTNMILNNIKLHVLG